MNMTNEEYGHFILQGFQILQPFIHFLKINLNFIEKHDDLDDLHKKNMTYRMYVFFVCT